MSRRRALLLSLLTPLALAVALAAGPAQAASAPSLAGLETAVGRSTPPASALVQPDPPRTATTPRVEARSYDRIALTTGVAAKAAPRGWQRGDDIWAPTRAGNDPAWSTVRARYWKNAAEDPRAGAQWDAENLARMRSGRAPQRFNPDKGGRESMELSHEPIPGRQGGRGLVPRWPQDHAVVDPYRRPGY